MQHVLVGRRLFFMIFSDSDNLSATNDGSLNAMPIFARRRLQHALDELAPHLDGGKARDLVGRLEDKKRPEQALGAEWELILLWALSKLGDFEVEPHWVATADKPDAFSGMLIPGEQALVEIMALSDVAISGEKEMTAAAQKICDVASGLQPRAGKHLSFRFLEESGYENGRYYRRRRVSRDFLVTPEITATLKSWLDDSPPSKPLRLTNAKLDALVDWQHLEMRKPQVWCSMPPLVHSIDDNALFKRLKEKKRQLRHSGPGLRRCIFIADAGSSLLNDLNRRDPCNRTVSGAAIIRHFLQEDGDVDAIAVFSIVRRQKVFGIERTKPQIVMTSFVSPTRPLDIAEGLRHVEAHLPAVRFEGYQARQLLQQQAFMPTAKRWNSGTTFMHKGNDGPIILKFSSRALLELMTGKISQAEFANTIGLNEGLTLAGLLQKGFTLHALSLAALGMDQDDDHCVVELRRDPAAAPLHAPQGADPSEEDRSNGEGI